MTYLEVEDGLPFVCKVFGDNGGADAAEVDGGHFPPLIAVRIHLPTSS